MDLIRLSPVTFLSRPLLDTRPDFDNPDHGQQDDFKLTQVAPGAATPWKPTTKVKRRLKLPFLLDTKVDWRTFRDFFADLGGSRRGFWLPIWLTDYPSYENLQGGTAIKIDDIELRNLFVADEQFAFLALIDRLQLEPLEIANITTPATGVEQLNVATTIAGDFNPDETICCGMLFCRLADDTIKYRFLTDGVVRVVLDFEELPQEYVTEHESTLPIYLYQFQRGELVWRMTNWPEPIIAGDECWSPDNIRHGSIRSGIDFLPENLELSVATDSPDHPLRDYLSRGALQATELTIWETDADTLTFDASAPIFKGRIGPTPFDKEGKIDTEVSSLLRLAELQLPKKQMQRTCDHRFGDEFCGVNVELLQITGTLLDVTTDYVEASEFEDEAIAQSDAQWFALGKVRIGTELRMVVGQDDGRLYIDEPFGMAQIGDEAVAEPGCNRRASHCVGRYDNIVNSTMFYLCPNQNPGFEQLFKTAPAGGKKA